MKTKKLIVAILLMLVLTLATNTNVFALQSTVTSGTSSEKRRATEWVISIRRIEGEGGGMGLKETVKSNALAESESNNIDVHLQKNTEYGAMVLLGASNYGKRATNASASNCWMNKGATSTSRTETNLATSTGNISGVYELEYENMNTSSTDMWEWTAGGGTTFLSNIDSRYINIYESKIGKAGDALEEGDINLSKWHTRSDYSGWAFNSYGLVRGGSSYGVFSRNGNSDAYGRHAARAAVVCGSGF